MLLQAVIPALLMNVYIVGLNQVYDIDIDKVRVQNHRGRMLLIIDNTYAEK